MSQDISYIRKAIRSCEEVDSPYDIKIGQHVKYITLKDNSEFFYEGGIYSMMGDNKIILKNKTKTEHVPLILKNPDGYVLYKTRLFVVNQDENKCEGKKKEEYEKIIQNQQQIIEKMNLQLKKQAMIINKLTKK